MISRSYLMPMVELTDRSLVSACPLGMSVRGAGLSSAAVLPVIPAVARAERPTSAPAVAVKAQAPACVFAAAANGAGAGTAATEPGAHGLVNAGRQQKTTQYGKWAFRGLHPWSDPT